MKFLSYNSARFDDCVGLFDGNCPQYFAENEREDYLDFLDSSPSNYFIGVSGGHVVSAFGLTMITDKFRARLSWILVLPNSKGNGYGLKMMAFAKGMALDKGFRFIDIAASHLSAPFFEKFGAIELKTITDGWGQGMHRVDMELSFQ